MKELTAAEKQMLLDLTALIDDDADKKEQTLRAFKWLAEVPQVGEEYENNKNVWTLQDKALLRVANEKAARKRLINKLINQ